MNFQLWDFGASTNTFNPTQKGAFPTNVSSLFRRPAKVVKPSSRNNSPRTSSRRRMTTTGHMPPVRTRSVVDHQRASMPQLSDIHVTTNRPLSWHPNMLGDMSQYQMANAGFHESLMATTPYTTAEVNGLVTPMSYSVVDEPQIHELITPLEGLSANEAGAEYGYGQDLNMTQYWLSQQAKDSIIGFDPSLYSTMNYQPWYPTSDQYMMPKVPTAPTSPSFLPVPDFGTSLDITVPEQEDNSEELVGMGLYDSPADVQTSSLLLGSFNGNIGRKTLKLEDSFEPSPEDDEDDDDEDGAVAPEEDDEPYDQAGISPTNIDYLQQPMVNAFNTSVYGQTMDNSYINHNQWHVPGHAGYNWI